MQRHSGAYDAGGGGGAAGRVRRGEPSRQSFTGTRHRRDNEWTFPVAVIGAAASGNPVGLAAVVGSQENDEVDTFPFPVTREVIEHGQDRYLIYCIVCHGATGEGEDRIRNRHQAGHDKTVSAVAGTEPPRAGVSLGCRA